MAKTKKTAVKKTPPKAKKTPLKTKKAPAAAKKVPKKELKKAPAKPKKTPPQTEKTYLVSEFSEMTYLTSHGVTEWLKQGKLQGEKDNKENWLVDAANLQLPFMKKLIR